MKKRQSHTFDMATFLKNTYLHNMQNLWSYIFLCM